MRKSVINKMRYLVDAKKKAWIDEGFSPKLVDDAVKWAYERGQGLAGNKAKYRDEATIEELQEETLPEALNMAHTWMVRFREAIMKSKDRLGEY